MPHSLIWKYNHLAEEFLKLHPFNQHEQDLSLCLVLSQVEKPLEAELTKHMLALSISFFSTPLTRPCQYLNSDLVARITTLVFPPWNVIPEEGAPELQGHIERWSAWFAVNPLQVNRHLSLPNMEIKKRRTAQKLFLSLLVVLCICIWCTFTDEYGSN